MGIPKKQAGFLLLDGLGAWVCVLIGGLLALEVFQAGKGLFLARRTLEESSRAAVHLLDTGALPPRWKKVFQADIRQDTVAGLPGVVLRKVTLRQGERILCTYGCYEKKARAAWWLKDIWSFFWACSLWDCCFGQCHTDFMLWDGSASKRNWIEWSRISMLGWKPGSCSMWNRSRWQRGRKGRWYGVMEAQGLPGGIIM